MAEAVIEDVSDTAFWVAHYRGLEGKRDDALFRDPSPGFSPATGASRSRNGSADVCHGLDGRDPDMHDRRLYSPALAQGVDTVVNLGAGLDTRPYRMELPASLVWVEVDYPAVIELKEIAARA